MALPVFKIGRSPLARGGWVRLPGASAKLTCSFSRNDRARVGTLHREGDKWLPTLAPINGRTLGSRLTPPLVHQCDLCGERRYIGSVLSSRSAARDEMMCVCDDCQNKLSRYVDDEGTLGG